MYNRVETRSGNPGQSGHVLCGSNRSDPVYKISSYDLNFALDHVVSDSDDVLKD